MHLKYYDNVQLVILFLDYDKQLFYSSSPQFNFLVIHIYEI